MRTSSMRIRSVGSSLILSFLILAGPAWAQSWERRDVGGVVVDGSTGAPVVGAWVQLADGGDAVFTNRDGRFVLHHVRIGTVAFEVGQLGYADVAAERTIDSGESALRFALDPDPIMLEGVRVVADRLAARRNAIPFSVRAYDTEHILTSGAADAYDFIRQNTFTRPCGSSTCLYRRGQVVRPVVFIDESPYYGGLDDLHGRPVEHIYLIEVIGSHVRVHTKNFAKLLATRSTPLMPVLMVSGF